MEDQTLPYGLSSLWAGAGAKYSWKGVCNCATQVTQLENRDREIYYCGGRDGSRVLMKWHSIFAGNRNLGGYAEAFDPMTSIALAETNANFQTRYPFPIIGAFGKGHDDLQYTSDEFVTIAQQNSTANRRIIVSNQEDFFRDFETNHGAGLQTHAAAYGNEWDALVASLAEVSARVKRSTEKLRAAEAMATLVSLNSPSFMTPRIAERDKAMLNLGLYFEHDWTADGSFISRTARANWSRQVEREITAYVDKLYDDARLELAKQISRSGSQSRFYVFNR
jgi:alpha-mannosidase